MKYFSVIFIVIAFYSCTSNKNKSTKFRSDFSNEEQQTIIVAEEIIEKTYFGSLITIDVEGKPRVRVMEPFEPEEDLIIWMATNPKSRKVTQIENNPKVALHYFDKNQLGYVSLMGKAYIVNDNAIKAEKWKEGWEKFYKNQEEAYMLIKFVPEALELINIAKGYNGDEKTWQPHKVVLRE